MNPFWTAVLAVATAVGSLGGLGGIVVVIFKAGSARRELTETRKIADDTRRELKDAREIVDAINQNGCNFRAHAVVNYYLPEKKLEETGT